MLAGRTIAGFIARQKAPWLGALDRSLMPREMPKPPPLIVVVSPPRSGSTLVGQTIAATLGLPHLTNLQYFLKEVPLLALRLQDRLPYRGINFTSHYGYTKGLSGMSEAGEFWARWFGWTVEERFARPPHSLRNESAIATLARMYSRTGRPILATCTSLSMYTEAIAEVFPGSRFIRVHRDLEASAISVARARQELTGGIENWWSVRPLECSNIGQVGPWGQIVLQLLGVEERIARAHKKKPSSYFSIEYPEFCAAPRTTITKLGEFLQSETQMGAFDTNIDLSRSPREFRVSRPADKSLIMKAVAGIETAARRLQLAES